MDIPTSMLENRDYADFAWARYRKLMWWMTLASAITVAIGLAWLWYMVGPVPWQMIVFTAMGIFFSVLLAAALMGLVFLSAGSGHDDAILDPFEEIS